ncbi:unnamed protein product [Ophioblennius macclurei]
MAEYNLQSSNNDFRRKWDKDEFENLARNRVAEERQRERGDGKVAPPEKRDPLRHRDYKVDLESRVGKTMIITKTTPQAEMNGYDCNVCDCVLKDSISYLDHINGKHHQRNLGMSMHVERSTLQQVKARFEMYRKMKEEKTTQKEYNFGDRMEELREKEKSYKAYKKEKQKERKRWAEDNDDDDVGFEEDNEMAALMGFSGFGSSKKSH